MGQHNALARSAGQCLQAMLCGNPFGERVRPRSCFALLTTVRAGMELCKCMCSASEEDPAAIPAWSPCAVRAFVEHDIVRDHWCSECSCQL